MVELHGWITIRETYESFLEEEDSMDLVVAKIRDVIDHLSYFKPEVKAQNGEVFIEFTLFCNRITPQVLEVFEFCKQVGQLGKGSYGLLYLYDDENTNGKENMFQVFSLTRGILKEHGDPFLSPIIPTVEDADKQYGLYKVGKHVRCHNGIFTDDQGQSTNERDRNK